jgi:hypothetical protein
MTQACLFYRAALARLRNASDGLAFFDRVTPPSRQVRRANSLAEEALTVLQPNPNRLPSHSTPNRGYRAILLFGQLILELHRTHRLALVVQKLAMERRLPLDSIELAGAACNIIHAIQGSRC